MDEVVPDESATLRFLIQVSDRVHLANVMRRIRVNPDVMRVARERPSERHQEELHAMRVARERGNF